VTGAFRAEVRDWLAAHVPPGPLPSLDTAEGFERHRAWEHELAAARLSVVTWPAAYGGRDATLADWLVFEEEYHAAGAPARVGQNGLFLLAPALLEFGTAEQRGRLLPRMAAGDDIWAQAWSEPEAGSDLAALRSRAVRRDGGWLVSGTKTWCSRAAFADRAFGLFRTDPGAGRHHGLSYLMFGLRAPGVTVRPIRQAVKHRLADVAIGLAFARPLADAAAAALAAGERAAGRDVSAAKVACAGAADRAARAALQVHGAIGYTAEHDLSRFLLQVRALVPAWGTSAEHRARVLAALR
jgi:alkylation response protein AidB-like acyl-CoA dehydrogenase